MSAMDEVHSLQTLFSNAADVVEMFRQMTCLRLLMSAVIYIVYVINPLTFSALQSRHCCAFAG